MTNEKVRFYGVMIVAFMDTPSGRNCDSVPAFELSASVQGLRETLKKEALNRWPPSSGWFGHAARVVPWSKEDFDPFIKAYSEGRLDMSEPQEEGMDFQFDERFGPDKVAEREWPDGID